MCHFCVFVSDVLFKFSTQDCTNKWTSQNSSSMPLSPIRKPDFDASNLKRSINKKSVNPDERKVFFLITSLCFILFIFIFFENGSYLNIFLVAAE